MILIELCAKERDLRDLSVQSLDGKEEEVNPSILNQSELSLGARGVSADEPGSGCTGAGLG